MGMSDQSQLSFAPDEVAGAHIIGGVVLGGMLSLVLWAGIIGVFLI